MSTPPVILAADDDEGHAILIEENLSAAGLDNHFERFRDGQEILDFLLPTARGPRRERDKTYALVLDINMPKVDGVEVLRRLRSVSELKELPVFIFSTSDDHSTVEECRFLACRAYIHKPIDGVAFSNALGRMAKLILEPSLDFWAI